MKRIPVKVSYDLMVDLVFSHLRCGYRMANGWDAVNFEMNATYHRRSMQYEYQWPVSGKLNLQIYYKLRTVCLVDTLYICNANIFTISSIKVDITRIQHSNSNWNCEL